MEQTLWNLFCETGDPMGYLLYKAGKDGGETKHPKKSPKPPQPPQGAPTGSV